MMNKYLKYLGVAFITVLFLSSCNNLMSKADKVAFKASINGAAGTSVLIENYDNDSLITDTLQIDGAGNFIFLADQKNATYYKVQLVSARLSFPVYLLPGDTLFMTADLNQFYQTQKFSGNASVYNNYITSYTNSSNVFQQNIRALYMKPEKAAMLAVDSVRKSNENRLAELKANNSDMDPVFEKIEQARILYEWALLHNIYPMYYQYLTKQSDFKTSVEFDSYLAECNLDDESLLSLDMYKMFLTTYIGRSMEMYYADSLLQEQIPSATLYRLQFIEKSFKSDKIRELLAYESVRDAVNNDGVNDYDLYSELFKKLCPNQEQQSEIETVVAEWKHLSKGADAYNFTYVDMEGNKVSMMDFRGKYVYVDVWATWCAPCRAEIPHLKRIEELFHGNNIVFISISVDQTQEPWRKMVREQSLQGVQLWAGQAKEFSEFYKIKGIPRFMLFDKDGKIYDTNAKRPSGGIEQEISSLPGI